MQSKISRKEAIRKFKEQKPLAGAYAVRCTVSGRVWAGTSRNLDATRNGTWFSLRSGSHIDRPLQEEWNAHGEPAFEYEILETFPDDLHPLAVTDLMKEKRNYWVSHLEARQI